MLVLLKHATLTVTERKGHCTEIARDLDIGKYDALVLQSGDGLVYEAVNGFCSRLDALVALQNCPLGIIPAGKPDGRPAV